MDKFEEKFNRNVNIEYEILTQEIYKCLLNADIFENIEVKHNIKIPAKSGCNHQVDVYCEFKLAGEIHRVAIECKNYTKEVSIAKVRDFFGVVYDIGNIKGIFVTKKGFQKGAKKFADYYGISLKELRGPEPNDWNGRLKTITLITNVIEREVNKVIVVPDLEWLKSKGLINSEKDAEKIIFESGKITSEIFIYEENGQPSSNFFELKQRLPYKSELVKNLIYTFPFDNNYMKSNLGMIKINQVSFNYDIIIDSSEQILEAEKITKAIIKDIETGIINFFKDDGSVN